MSAERAGRVLGLALVLAGLLGVAAIVAGYFPPLSRESTLAFPVAVAAGVALMHSNRPGRSNP